MPESINHIVLVEQMVAWISDQYLNGSHAGLLVDLPSSTSAIKPPRLFGFVPDVYTRLASTKQVIVGEAKTARDLECEHTREQFMAFLRECASHQNSLLVVAVPWYMSRLAKSILRNLQKNGCFNPVSAVVLDRLR